MRARCERHKRAGGEDLVGKSSKVLDQHCCVAHCELAMQQVCSIKRGCFPSCSSGNMSRVAGLLLTFFEPLLCSRKHRPVCTCSSGYICCTTLGRPVDKTCKASPPPWKLQADPPHPRPVEGSIGPSQSHSERTRIIMVDPLRRDESDRSDRVGPLEQCAMPMSLCLNQQPPCAALETSVARAP